MKIQRQVQSLSMMSDQALRLEFGELSAREIRTIRAVLRAIGTKYENMR